MSWVTEQSGIAVQVWPLVDGLDPGIAGSISLGLRRNPRRAQLLVSGVLGKHVPVRASLCLAAGELLAQAVGRAVAGPYDVIGFAETATGLGHQVAHGLDAEMYVHTTRRPGDHPRLSFSEEHSHAVEQAFTPRPGALDAARVAVLVDDEISTGRTALNAIAALAPVTGHTTWMLAALLDSRSDADRLECLRRADGLGVTLLSAALLGGRVSFEADSAARAAALVAGAEPPRPAEPAQAPGPAARPPGAVRIIELDSGATPVTARRSFTAADDARLRKLATGAARAVGDLGFGDLGFGEFGDAVVVGDEELMYLPQLIAQELGDLRVCTTTRSPALALDVPGYPLRTAAVFDSVSEPGRTAYSYNTLGERALLLVTEDSIDARCRSGALAALAAGGAQLTVLTLR